MNGIFRAFGTAICSTLILSACGDYSKDIQYASDKALESAEELSRGIAITTQYWPLLIEDYHAGSGAEKERARSILKGVFGDNFESLLPTDLGFSVRLEFDGIPEGTEVPVDISFYTAPRLNAQVRSNLQSGISLEPVYFSSPTDIPAKSQVMARDRITELAAENKSLSKLKNYLNNLSPDIYKELAIPQNDERTFDDFSFITDCSDQFEGTFVVSHVRQIETRKGNVFSFPVSESIRNECPLREEFCSGLAGYVKLLEKSCVIEQIEERRSEISIEEFDVSNSFSIGYTGDSDNARSIPWNPSDGTFMVVSMSKSDTANIADLEVRYFAHVRGNPNIPLPHYRGDNGIEWARLDTGYFSSPKFQTKTERSQFGEEIAFLIQEITFLNDNTAIDQYALALRRDHPEIYDGIK